MPVCASTAGRTPQIIFVDPVYDTAGRVIGSAAGTDYSKCDLVVLTGADYHLLGPSDLMRLTPEQGSDLAIAIGLVWGIAYVFKLVARTIDLNSDEGER